MDECQLPTRKDLGLQFDRSEGVQYTVSGRKGMCVELLMWVCYSSGEPWSWTVDLQQDHGTMSGNIQSNKAKSPMPHGSLLYLGFLCPIRLRKTGVCGSSGRAVAQ